MMRVAASISFAFKSFIFASAICATAERLIVPAETLPGSFEPDFRLAALTRAIEQLRRSEGSRAEHVLLSLSDPTNDPIAAATTKAACGAWPGQN